MILPLGHVAARKMRVLAQMEQSVLTEHVVNNIIYQLDVDLKYFDVTKSY